MNLKKYYKSEIIKHNTAKDCWIIVFNKVYDITSFVYKHPGGSEILLSRAGEDASSFFQTRHGNMKRIQKILEQYCIGELYEEEKINEEAFNEPFLDEMIKICQKRNLYTPSKSRKRKYNTIRVSLVLLFFTLALLAFYAQLPLTVSIPLIILQSLTANSLFGIIAHEHTHRPLPENAFLKGILIVIWPLIWPFITRKALIYEHNSHHVKIGDPVYDYEVMGFSHFIRYSGEVKHRFLHKIQHRIAFLWYMFYANIITTIGGIFTPYWDIHKKKVKLIHISSVLFTVTFYIIIPSLIYGNWLKFFLLYGLFQCVLFFFIYMGAAISHFTPQANQKIPKEMENKFAYYVCNNTTNFEPDSMFWFLFTGGFNLQIEHHLNAFIPAENVKEFQIIVKDLCKKYNYPYIEYPTLYSLYKAHYQYLYNLSKSKSNSEVLQEVDNKRGFQAR